LLEVDTSGRKLAVSGRIQITRVCPDIVVDRKHDLDK